MPERDQYPAALQLRRFFSFEEPLPVMREVWSDELRRALMTQRTVPQELPAEAVTPLLNFDLFEHLIGLPFRFRIGLEDPGRDETGTTEDLLRQALPSVREGYRTDPTLISRLHRAAQLAIGAKEVQRNTLGELRCDACSRGSRALLPTFGHRAERAWHAHHLEPLSLGEREATPSDFGILCAFCHEIAHSKGVTEVWSIEELQAKFQ
jgi:hypothetical protein